MWQALASIAILWAMGCAHFPVGSPAPLLYTAENASFTAGQDSSSFWSSDSGNFTFGFKRVNAGGSYLLSVWHSADRNRTALWWKGGEDDPTVPAGSTLNLTSNGSLQLRSPQGLLLWSTSTASAVYGQLQDSSNVALLEDDGVSVIWQSFDSLQDSLMLSDLQDSVVSNKSVLLQSRRNLSSFARGRFHIATDAYLNLYFHSSDFMDNDFIFLYANMNISGGGLRIDRDNLVRFRSTKASNRLKRLTLDYDGNLRAYKWESNASLWTEMWQMLNDRCLWGSPCGPFGICKEISNSTDGISCNCPPGYRARVTGDASQGCENIIEFNLTCGTKSTNYSATMVELSSSDYRYNDLTYQSKVGLNDCKVLCLNECACMAASYRDDGVCFIKGNSKTGYLLNGHSSDSNTLLIKMVEPRSLNGASHGRRSRLIGIGVGVPVVLALFFALVCSALFHSRGKGACLKWHKRHRFEADGRVKYFEYDELVMATHNFSEKLGEGGFGVVYKGWVGIGEKSGMQNLGQLHLIDGNMAAQRIAVAVKFLKGWEEEERGIGDGRRDRSEAQFRSEVNTLGNLHHINLVSLLGHCCRRQRGRWQRFLVYEYMGNGSLDKLLSSSQHEVLPWAARYSIALGAARGIAYLHHECSPPILHCDIKPHNILLDNQFRAKVADFGFAKHFHLDSHVTMSNIRGTRGYLAPEWLTSQELTSKVDVFSFGVVLLQLVRGFNRAGDIKMPTAVEWAIDSLRKGMVTAQPLGNAEHEKFDADLDETTSTSNEKNDTNGDSEEADEKLRVLKAAIWCIQPRPSIRPTMWHVVQLIDGTIAVEDPPILHPASVFLPPPLLLETSDAGTSTTTASAANYYCSEVSAR